MDQNNNQQPQAEPQQQPAPVAPSEEKGNEPEVKPAEAPASSDTNASPVNQ